MATHRHPHAEEFRQKLASLRLLTARLDDPATRGPVLPRLQQELLRVLGANPRPSYDLCQKIYAIQSDLHRLFRSRRREYALVARIDQTLEQAKQLAERPPSGYR